MLQTYRQRGGLLYSPPFKGATEGTQKTTQVKNVSCLWVTEWWVLYSVTVPGSELILKPPPSCVCDLSWDESGRTDTDFTG